MSKYFPVSGEIFRIRHQQIHLGRIFVPNMATTSFPETLLCFSLKLPYFTDAASSPILTSLCCRVAWTARNLSNESSFPFERGVAGTLLSYLLQKFEGRGENLHSWVHSSFGQLPSESSDGTPERVIVIVNLM